jgi:Tol biopolymer transport system component
MGQAGGKMLRVWCGAALVLTVLFATANMALSREWQAGETGEDWQLVYTYPLSTVGEAGNIMNLDGSNARPLAFNGAQIASPICSPDGSYLIFDVPDTIFVMDVVNGQELWNWDWSGFPRPQAGHIAVSNDGQTALFHGGYRYSQGIDAEIWDKWQNSSPKFTLTNNLLRTAFWVDLSPDGNQIAFQSSSGGTYLAKTDGSGITQLTPGGQGPDWSPDGSMIAFSANWDGAFNIYILDVHHRIWAQVTHLPPVAHPGVGNLQPSWSPDGKQLVFIYFPEQGTSDTTVYMINIGSGEQRLVDPQVGIVSSACLLQTRPIALTSDPLP